MAKSDIDTWKGRITLSKDKFKSEVKDNIEKYRKYYKGDQWGDSSSTMYKDKTVDNMVYSNIRTIMPSINLQNPKIFVAARKKPHNTQNGLFDTLSASAVFELLINYYWQELEIKRQSDKCLMDALLGPWGIMWLGYSGKSEYVGTHELIKEDSAFAVRISPMDFLTDPEGKDSHLEDAKWVARKWVKTLDEVKKDKRYKNTRDLKSNAKAKTEFSKFGSSNTLSPTLSQDRYRNAKDLDRVEGWEIWDKENKRIITLIESHDKLIQDDDGWPIDFEGFPCETLYFNENPDELYPVSDVEIYIPAQDELNRINSCQLAHIRNVSQRKYIGNESKFANNDDEERKLADGPDGTIVWANGDPTNAVIPLRDANVSQDLYITKNALKNSIREVAGVGQFEQGVAMKFDTATEPALMAQGLTIRRSERIDILEKFLNRIARKLGKILQQTLSKDSMPLNQGQFQFARQFAASKIEKIVGQNEAQILLPWLNYSKEDIQGDYNFNIDVGSTAPINQEKRKQDLVSLHQLMAGNPYINPEEMTKRTFEVFDEKDVDRLMKTSEEVSQEQQQAQQSALQAEIAKDQPKRDTDLQKTREKNATNEKTTLMKILGGGLKGGGGQ